MNAVRAEVLNLLLCLVLGGVIGGMVGFSQRGRQKDGFVRVPETAPRGDGQRTDAGVLAMQGIDDAGQRRFALLNNLTRLAMTDLPRALALLPDDASHDAVLREWITQRLAHTRPDLAVQAAAAMRDADARVALMAPSVFAWYELNAPQAAGWLRNHLDEALARQLVNQSMNHSPAFVGRVLFDLKDGGIDPRNFRMLLQRWAQLDNADAFRFMEMLPVESFPPAMVEGVGGSLISLPAGPVKAWLQRLPEETRATIIEDMVAVLPSATTLASAQQWMGEMAPLAGRSDAVAQWFSALVRLAPDQAQQALDVMEDVPERDACISGCVLALGVRDRASALDWTLELADDQQRQSLAQQQWLAWLQEDRAAALLWLESGVAVNVFSKEQLGVWSNRYKLRP